MRPGCDLVFQVDLRSRSDGRRVGSHRGLRVPAVRKVIRNIIPVRQGALGRVRLGGLGHKPPPDLFLLSRVYSLQGQIADGSSGAFVDLESHKPVAGLVFELLIDLRCDVDIQKTPRLVKRGEGVDLIIEEFIAERWRR